MEGPAPDAQPLDPPRLIDDPAVAGLEILNEDSYLFWTFNSDAIPDPELRLIETQFGAWLKQKYGSIDRALRSWGGQKIGRDRPAEVRVGFRPLWNMFNEKTGRDKDTVRFLVESQRGFYREMYEFLRGLGFRGVITASNWITASPEVFGPLEKYSYTVTDFIDRHGYFGCRSRGEASEWSVRDGHTYADRSALRFDPEEPGKPKVFVHPAMDPSYDGKPSMISETTWNRPNRYRSEAPLFYAAYGALQDSDAIVHFALDTAAWSVKPGFFMQPWTLMSPAMMGQFPAAALIYRKGLVATGDLLVDLDLKVGDLLDLKGTPLPQDAALDELRLKDVPKGTTLKPGNVIDPLVHFAGRTNVRFTERGGSSRLKDLKPFIDRRRQVVSSTTGQLRLDYGKGVLTIDAPAAQGISGALREAGAAELKDLSIASKMELGHIVAVSLDGLPLATSRRILLQVMSEEKPTDFRTEPAPGGEKKIASTGHDPWLVKEIDGVVKLKRADASHLKVTALDFNGEPGKSTGTAREIRLVPELDLLPHHPLRDWESFMPSETDSNEPAVGPKSWTAATVGDTAGWSCLLPDALMAHLRSLVEERAWGEGPIPGMRLTEQDRTALRGYLTSAKHDLERGHGFVVLDRLPVERISEREAIALYWMIGQLLGEPVVQNVQGTLLYDVRDSGQEVAKGARFSVTNYESSFHTDNSFGETVVDYVGLLCLKTARAGGVSQLVNGLAVVERLRHEHPDALETLGRPFHVDRRGGVREGETPTVLRPVIEREGPEPLFRYLRYWIEAGHGKAGQPLTPAQTEALDRLDEVLNRPALRAEFSLEPGQVYFINNRWILHNRTAFEDHPEPERRRHLVRLWLEAGNGSSPPR